MSLDLFSIGSTLKRGIGFVCFQFILCADATVVDAIHQFELRASYNAGHECWGTWHNCEQNDCQKQNVSPQCHSPF